MVRGTAKLLQYGRRQHLAAALAALLLVSTPGIAGAEPDGQGDAGARPAASPVIVDAVDYDPDNKLWNCETNHVPFGNEEIDRSRCFTFRYAIPAEGIQSATVHIGLNTLGSLQDTDATIMAIGGPYEPCAWAQGNMAGCVILHGGFKDGERSLNLNLLDLACDASVQGSPEAQALVRRQLETGVVHMLLQDDTAVYGAQLVLNGGPPSFSCGTSESEPQAFIPPPQAPAAQPAESNPPSEGVSKTSASAMLTGTSSPVSANTAGATVAAVVGAILLTVLAIFNSLSTRPPAQTTAGAGPGVPRDLGEITRNQAVDSLPDARDAGADYFADLAAGRDKKRRLEEERKRLEALVADKQRAYAAAGNALKQVIDQGGDFVEAQRAWQQAGAELQKAQSDLQKLLQTFPELQRPA